MNYHNNITDDNIITSLNHRIDQDNQSSKERVEIEQPNPANATPSFPKEMPYPEKKKSAFLS